MRRSTRRPRHPEGPCAVYESLLDAVGRTPLIKLNRVTAGLAAEVWVKVEFANPGGSVKDRAALAMVRQAERDGSLRPGGVIVEGTSGNTGIGLAMVAAQLGYGSIVVTPNSIAVEKVALLRAYGAEVVQTEAKLPREHPEHVIALAKRIAAETPGGWYADQYDNPANPRVHELTTGPELWEQTGGRVTHLVAGIGTGGTISGTGRYLKQHGVSVVAVDPESSAYSGGDGSPYFVEAVGHYRHPATVDDAWPESYDQGVVDRFERIPDRESLTVTRRLAREEGLLVGGSAGTAVAGALRVAAELGPEHMVVAVLPDSGRNYLSKYFDDGWMTRLGFLDDPAGLLADMISPVHTVTTRTPLADASAAHRGRGTGPADRPGGPAGAQSSFRPRGVGDPRRARPGHGDGRGRAPRSGHARG